jgi:hypothetical protein
MTLVVACQKRLPKVEVTICTAATQSFQQVISRNNERNNEKVRIHNCGGAYSRDKRIRSTSRPRGWRRYGRSWSKHGRGMGGHGLSMGGGPGPSLSGPRGPSGGNLMGPNRGPTGNLYNRAPTMNTYNRANGENFNRGQFTQRGAKQLYNRYEGNRVEGNRVEGRPDHRGVVSGNFVEHGRHFRFRRFFNGEWVFLNDWDDCTGMGLVEHRARSPGLASN